MIKTAIIGGKGLGSPDYLEKVRELFVVTPFGKPNPVIYSGLYNDIEVVHIARHGKDDAIPPSKINHKANLYALKQLDCSYILAATNCRSLQEEICPGEIIILDQFIDMTRQRISGINDDLNPGKGNYLSMGDPFSEELRDHLIEAAIVQGITVHTKGVVLSIEGPRLPSRAESTLYRSWGSDVINMVTAPEVILANELGIPYATLALCTGYDSWRVSDIPLDPVYSKAIISENHDKMIQMLTYVLKKIEQEG
jgi:5'-methylthioadenosine phosphorylase